MPRLAVSFAVLLAIAALALLIYFFHHAAASMRVSHLLSSIGRELFAAIDAQMSEGTRIDGNGVPETCEQEDARFPEEGYLVQSVHSGYIDIMDTAGLKKVAADRDVVLRVLARPGDFVLEGSDLVEIAPADKATPELTEEVLSAFSLGANRFVVGEVESAARELSEIAVRALSPGVNNPNTAIECLDQLVAALSHAIQARGHIGSGVGAATVTRAAAGPGSAKASSACAATGAVGDGPVTVAAAAPAMVHLVDGKLRLLTPRLGLPGLVALTFDEIRHHSRGTPTVQLRLIEAVAGLVGQTTDNPTRAALLHQAEMIERAAPDIPEADDREAILALCRAVLGRGRD